MNKDKIEVNMNVYDIPILIKLLEKEEKQIKELQERIDKATKYLRSNEWAKDYENSNCRTHLLNILQGKDKGDE